MEEVYYVESPRGLTIPSNTQLPTTQNPKSGHTLKPHLNKKDVPPLKKTPNTLKGPTQASRKEEDVK